MLYFLVSYNYKNKKGAVHIEILFSLLQLKSIVIYLFIYLLIANINSLNILQAMAVDLPLGS